MSSTATLVVTKLNFSKFASEVRACDGILDSSVKYSEKQIQKDITEQAPAWVASHVYDKENCDVIHLEGTVGHPNWNNGVRQAIEKRLKAHRNTAGQVITLHADGDR